MNKNILLMYKNENRESGTTLSYKNKTHDILFGIPVE